MSENRESGLSGEGAYLKVRVSPGARKDEITGWHDDAVRVRVRAAPERGKANEAVCRLIAERLGLPPSAVSVKTGAASRQKLLAIEGLGDAEVRRRLGAAML